MTVIRKFYGTGFGNLHTSQRNIPAAAPGPPGPPFLLTSADSGLWVNPVSGKIELNGLPGANPLLQNTAMEMGGFNYEIDDGPALWFLIDPAFQNITIGDGNGVFQGMTMVIDNSAATINLSASLGNDSALLLNDGQQRLQFFSNPAGDQFLSLDVQAGLYQIGDISKSLNGTFLRINDTGAQVDVVTGAAGNLMLDLDNGAQNYQIGDISGTGNGSNIDIDDLNKHFQFFTLTGSSLDFNESTGLYVIGDVSNSGNGHILKIDDATQVIDLGDNVGILLRLDNSATPGTLTYFGGVGQRFLELDGTNQVYSIGDIDAMGSSSVFIINDPNKLAFIQVGPVTALKLDQAGGRYQIGDVLNNGTGSKFTVEDSSERFIMTSDAVGGFQYFLLDVPNQLYQIGDINAGSTGNNTFLSINDATQRVVVNGSPQMIGTTTSYTNGAAASIGTLLNAPAAGNPTKWIPINDNGTTRFIPAW